MTAPSRAATAFAVALAGIALFSFMDAAMKSLVLALGVYNAMLWRSLAAAVMSGMLIAGRKLPSAKAMRVHLIRGFVGVVMALLFFWGLARVPMAQAVALSFIAPIIALFLAALLLKEKIGLPAILAALVAFAGVLVILLTQAGDSGGRANVLGGLAILASAVCYAWNVILMRQQALLADPIEVAFFQSLIPAVVLVCASPMLGVIPAVSHLPALVGAAALSIGSLLLLSWAYARAEASYLVTVEYSAFIWASLLGYLAFGERLSLATIAGAALIVIGCLIAVRRRPNEIAIIGEPPAL